LRTVKGSRGREIQTSIEEDQRHRDRDQSERQRINLPIAAAYRVVL
jgi:hypothetical protein